MKAYKFVMPEIIFDSGSISQVGESCVRLGAKKVFIVTDDEIVSTEWLEPVIKSCHVNKQGFRMQCFQN